MTGTGFKDIEGLSCAIGCNDATKRNWFCVSNRGMSFHGRRNNVKAKEYSGVTPYFFVILISVSLVGMQTFEATYNSETNVTCNVDLEGIQAPASLPVYVTPQAKPLFGRTAIQKYVAAVSSTKSADLIIGAPAPKLEKCQFTNSMLTVNFLFNIYAVYL